MPDSPAMDDFRPVDEREFVFRRIHRSHVDPTLPTPILAAAFRPNPNDDTGLSVFREAFVSAAGTLTTVSPQKRNDYYVARLAVRDLLAMRMHVRPEPDPDGPSGHAVIPELSWAAYQADKQRLKEVQLALARFAGADIVHRPS